MATLVALDAGHGGADPGAVYNGRREKDDTLSLVFDIGGILEQYGVDVYYTRVTDIYETPTEKALEANAVGADYLVSIHRNSSPFPNQYSGVESLVYSRYSRSVPMAENINRQLSQVGYRNLGIQERPNLAILNKSNMPAVLVEVGFINTDADNVLFDTKRNEIAQAIADGIYQSL